MKFPHTPPDQYSYTFVEFKRDVIAIWIHNHSKFSYKTETPISSIWGFYNSKKRTFHSPINSKTIGKEVDVNETSPYSAMIPKITYLEKCFV